jgi:uncharacterized membrane protein (DUF485 family)
MIKKPIEEAEDLIKCPVCEIYLKKAEGFICIRCRRGPLCKKHKIGNSKECASCIFDRKRKTFSELKEQETSLKSFLMFLQFLFMVFVIFFIAFKAGLDKTVEFLQHDFIRDGLPYMGVLAVIGYIVFYVIMIGQRSRIEELEMEMKHIEFRR